MEQTAERTGIPERALEAYSSASIQLAELMPECGIGWNTLAGIGATESRHGGYGGATIGPDGTVSPAIVGVPLDGGEGVAAIPDTDGGAFDGDTEWDRAVGPMQFIPETWSFYGRDGNGDGQADPHQFDDAALSAGVLLCERGGDLTTDDGWNTAVLAYNQSLSYANTVADRAESYAASTSTATE
ncbi:MAG: lytic transglycosylase domain-containing protein [Ancrocorticia sp.]|uniref:lytic transglycosylase domain-containing protein n=1 Tax=Ancrocorticia sp. TaxID=2593684 RepID=UPI003F8E267D